jgi:dihydroneopterin aldolase
MRNIQRWVKVNNFETLMRLGVYPKEQIKAQRVIIDVSLEVNVKIHNDNINNVLSYEEIILIINKISKKNHKFLAETVAEDIAKKCLKLDTAKAVYVSLKKPDIITGKTEVGVEIKLSK